MNNKNYCCLSCDWVTNSAAISTWFANNKIQWKSLNQQLKSFYNLYLQTNKAIVPPHQLLIALSLTW